MNKHIVAGLNLGGEGTDKTTIAIFELNLDHNSKAINLLHLFERVGAGRRTDADTALQHILKRFKKLSLLAINAPLSLPPCFSCKCSYDKKKNTCSNQQNQYLQKLSLENKRMCAKNKHFLPYIHRPVDAYLRTFIDSTLPHHEPLGSNNSPLTARAYYLKKSLFPDLRIIESYPRLNLVMLRKKLKLLKKQVIGYNSIDSGKFYRQYILDVFTSDFSVSINKTNRDLIINNSISLNAFILGYVACLHIKGKTVRKPSDFPKHADWIIFPKEN